MEVLKREEIPAGKIQIRKLDKSQGDMVELVDAEKVLLSIDECHIIIDEDTKKIVPRDELAKRAGSGEIKRVRTVPPVAGGDGNILGIYSGMAIDKTIDKVHTFTATVQFRDQREILTHLKLVNYDGKLMIFHEYDGLKLKRVHILPVDKIMSVVLNPIDVQKD